MVNLENKEDLLKVLESKVAKHEEKLKAQKESEPTLRTMYDSLKETNPEKAESYHEKIVSTLKHIEYHTASAKTYNKVINMIKSN